MAICLTDVMIQKRYSINISYKTSDVKVKLDLPNYATYVDLKGPGGDTCNLADKSDLASLKAEVDKIDIDKQKSVPDNLSKLSIEVGNEILKNLCMTH